MSGDKHIKYWEDFLFLTHQNFYSVYTWQPINHCGLISIYIKGVVLSMLGPTSMSQIGPPLGQYSPSGAQINIFKRQGPTAAPTGAIICSVGAIKNFRGHIGGAQNRNW